MRSEGLEESWIDLITHGRKYGDCTQSELNGVERNNARTRVRERNREHTSDPLRLSSQESNTHTHTASCPSALTWGSADLEPAAPLPLQGSGTPPRHTPLEAARNG